ncbi:hypothetical protein FT663_05236 [Candidozyma haemuli var. vulneris]|uniref:Alpha-MPP n=1 Tax=Candidozyma haemuli TaxID=45357 RepID=A0A2V1B0C4_9ASCO|nr:hypothetical protein CXQ85_003093 [[Candida] haemuloni]KAF3985581.1 hypothetical protein FT663_05236 [[Candida] haemuloni var. vulneris]KAF3988517.1 hypothetical protein FT662_03386 [[Candida] haemuloni var. vulneris]PVH23359.1 hypothetical protein CXQ85_003093 [[Candida] haemuloni]
MLSRCARITRRTLSSSSSPIEITKLANGLRVVTDSTPGHFSALGAYIDAGSRYENDETSGHSHIMDRLAFKSTSNRSGIQMMDDLARLGGNFMCGAQRESIMYQSSVFNKDVNKMFDCIAETIREPKLTTSEIAEAGDTVAYELSELVHKHDLFLPEVLHAAAYQESTLGRPLHGSADSLSRLSPEGIASFHEQFYTPENTVVAMVGVPHQEALNMVESRLGDWKNSGIPIVHEPAVYRGGEVSLPYQEPLYSNLPKLVHMQIAFETAGLLSDELYALATLQKLFGGGSSFSAGGPGKGMFSRLFRVLNQHPFVENCSSFNHAYTDSGLFGITISCYLGHEEYMAQVAAHEFAKVLETDISKGGITSQEFRRAKNQLISSLLMNVESKLAALEDIGRQVQCQDKITSVDEMVKKIEALTIDDVRKVAQKVFTGNGNGSKQSPPSVAIQGDRAEIGDVEFVLRYFGLGAWNSPAPSQPRDYSNQKSTIRKWFS